MDTSGKEAVQRGIVHPQQRFHSCTENGKVNCFFHLLYSVHFHFLPRARPAYWRCRASSSYKNTERSGVFHGVYLCVQLQHQLKKENNQNQLKINKQIKSVPSVK